MMKQTIIMISIFLMACQPPKNIQIKEFKENFDSRIGDEMYSEYSLKSKNFRKIKISQYIMRYNLKMDNPNYIGGKDCEIYQDVDIRTNRIIAWGYVSAPDKCRSKIGWGGPW